MAVLTLALGVGLASAEILPAERRTTWNPGLNSAGGIPNRTTTFRTLSPSGGDDTDLVQAALDACPPNQVVKLTAGTFRISAPNASLWPKSNTTLRGSGPGQTILLSTSGERLIYVGVMWYDWTSQTRLTADAVKGTSSVTIASNPGLKVGEIVNVNETYDPALTWFTDGQNGDYQGWGEGRKGPQASSRPIGQAMEIASISGAGPYTVSFTTPFHVTLRTSRAAHIARLSGGLGGQREWVGIEDLTLSDAGGGDDGGPISFAVAKYSWAKNIEATRSEGPVLFKSAVRCELRDSYIHSTTNPNPGGGGYGIAVDSYSADNLVENNIVWAFNKVIVMRGSGGGNVIGYNYMEDAYGAGYPTIVENGLNASHMTTPHYELFEGNQSFNFSSDITWGNSIYITAFRNHLTALRRSIAPLKLTDTYNRRAVEVIAKHWWYSILGNVLGTAGQKPPPGHGRFEWLYSVVGSVFGSRVQAFLPGQNGSYYENSPGADCWSGVCMWKIGSNGDPVDPDPLVVARTIRHGNFDYVSNAVAWDPANSDHSLPDSLYLTSKPAFFGSSPWPWVDPTGTTKLHTLPARARFDAIIGGGGGP